jgi:hypothetical protein
MEILLLLLIDALPPSCDGPALLNSAGVCVNSMAITATGTHPGTGGNSEIIISLDNNFETIVDGIVVLLPPSAT